MYLYIFIYIYYIYIYIYLYICIYKCIYIHTLYRCDVVCVRVYIIVCHFGACICLYTTYLCDLVSAHRGCQPETAPACLVDNAEQTLVAVLCQHISTCPVCACVCAYVYMCVCASTHACKGVCIGQKRGSQWVCRCKTIMSTLQCQPTRPARMRVCVCACQQLNKPVSNKHPCSSWMVFGFLWMVFGFLFVVSDQDRFSLSLSLWDFLYTWS